MGSNRALIFLAGGGLLATATHANILETGGYGTPESLQYIAMSIALAVCSAGVGIASAHQRYFIVAGMIFGMVAGEAFLLIKTAERAIAVRELEQAPFKIAIEQRTELQARLNTERNKLASYDTSERLKAALSAEKTVNSEIAEQASLPGCRKNCRELLQNRADTAANEVQAARAELKKEREKAEKIIAEIAAEQAALPPTRSPTPLADRLGIAPWFIDVAAAALLSIGLNMLAAILFAFSGHGWEHEPKPQKLKQLSPISPPPLKPVTDPTQHTARYILERIQKSENQNTKLVDMISDYRDWCQIHGFRPLSEHDVTVELSQLFMAQGYKGEIRDDEPYIIGITIRGSS